MEQMEITRGDKTKNIQQNYGHAVVCPKRSKKNVVIFSRRNSSFRARASEPTAGPTSTSSKTEVNYHPTNSRVTRGKYVESPAVVDFLDRNYCYSPVELYKLLTMLNRYQSHRPAENSSPTGDRSSNQFASHHVTRGQKELNILFLLLTHPSRKLFFFLDLTTEYEQGSILL